MFRSGVKIIKIGHSREGLVDCTLNAIFWSLNVVLFPITLMVALFERIPSFEEFETRNAIRERNGFSKFERPENWKWYELKWLWANTSTFICEIITVIILFLVFVAVDANAPSLF
jgi:hypothetical protein